MLQPRALVIVAWLFIASGIVAIISIVGNLLFGHRLVIDISVIDLWIGHGLLKGQARSRRWALFMLFVGFLILPVGLVLVILFPGVPTVTVFNNVIGTVPRSVLALLFAGVAVLTFWQYRVLERPEVRALF